MCKVGDIILVFDYKHDGKLIKQHSFIIIDDSGGEIQSLPYDFICNAMSSFKDEKQKARKLSYPGNLPYSHDDSVVENGNDKDGFVKAEQLYFFKKDSLHFRVIGSVTMEFFNELIEFIENLKIDIEYITDDIKDT